MDKCDLLLRHSLFHELIFYILIHIESAIALRCGEVAED